jgi:hypothetical protein
MVSCFVAAGVLNQELVFQNSRELLLVGMRMEPIMAEIRSGFKDPCCMKNLKTVAKAYVDYLNRSNPDTAAAFKARVGG